MPKPFEIENDYKSSVGKNILKRSGFKIKVSGWNNGDHSSTGAGYGIRIGKKNRDLHFDRGWNKAIIEIEGHKTVSTNITSTFWTTCPELRSKYIGQWMILKKLAPWSKGNVPELILEQKEENRFILKLS